MRLARPLAPVLVAVAAAANAAPAASAQTQEQQMLRRHFDRTLDGIVDQARKSLPGLLLYEADVRSAILEISQHPGLVALVTAAAEEGQPVLEIAAAYPPAVADAAALLAGHADVLEILDGNLLVTGVLGRVYAGDPKFVARTVDKLAEEARVEQKESVDQWAKGLREDATAMKEMEDAAAEYAKEQGYGAPEPGDSGEDEPADIIVDSGYDSPDDDWWYSWYGWCWVGDGIIIGDTPCGDFIEWLLEHCDRFPNLGDRVIHHFQERRAAGKGVELPGELADAVQRWQSKYPLTTMQGFMNDDGHRAERLRELGQAIRETPAGGGATGVQQLIARDPQRFPSLSRPAAPDRGAVKAPATRPAQAPAARPIQRVQPSVQQQYQRAVTRHRTAWGGRAPAYRPGGGGMRGGGGGGGGRGGGRR